ncbi:hypothetical protein L8N14_017260 [Serratia marcescens]|nr:hypothetical protein [Serratia marcescens]
MQQQIYELYLKKRRANTYQWKLLPNGRAVEDVAGHAVTPQEDLSLIERHVEELVRIHHAANESSGVDKALRVRRLPHSRLGLGGVPLLHEEHHPGRLHRPAEAPVAPLAPRLLA